MSPVPIVQFRGVKKAFGPKVVYDHLDLDVYEGESLTIIGGSGQGKSVMLKMLVGLLTPDSGSILFQGQEVSGLKEEQYTAIRKRIGMLFQGAALFDSLSVRENIAYGLREHERLGEDEINERVRGALAAVGLPGVERVFPADLSGGMKKRVGLARAIAIRPEVLLYDEPTTGLDPINTTRINRLIVSLKESLHVTSIIVTHDMQSAFFVSDRIAMIHQGRVVFTGTPDEIRHSTDERVRAFIEGHAPEDDELTSLTAQARP